MIAADRLRGDTDAAGYQNALLADWIVAYPLFDISDRGGRRLRDDHRWRSGAPPLGNADDAWVRHIPFHLAPHGVASVLLANGSLSSNTGGEGEELAIAETDPAPLHRG